MKEVYDRNIMRDHVDEPGCITFTFLSFFPFLLFLYVWLSRGFSLKTSFWTATASFVVASGVVFFFFEMKKEDILKSRKKFEEKALNIITGIFKKNLPANDTWHITGHFDFIGFSESEKQIVLGKVSEPDLSVTHKVITPDKILNIEIRENGKDLHVSAASTQSIDTQGASTGALIGALAGATFMKEDAGILTALGAISGARTEQEVQSLSLVLTVDDLAAPAFEINFVNFTSERDSEEYKKAAAFADNWLKILSILKSRTKTTN